VQRVLRLTRPARHVLRLPAAILGDILSEACRTWPLETGGVLLGDDQPDGTRARLTVGPGPGAMHRRRAFEPDQPWQARRTAEAWAEDPSLRYLGDWHTHPDGTARLSQDDVAALRLIASSPAALQPAPIMLVAAVARDGTVRLGGGRHRPGEAPLRLCAETEPAAP
jgi:integrative and conjugative element protein (TIGR02256 family)